MLWPREWALIVVMLIVFGIFVAVLDASRDWQLVTAVDRTARSWLHSVVCDRAPTGGEP